MRLLEAIIDANHRALAGDEHAGLHPADFADELPLVALTCIDVRLNSLLPQVLGIRPEHFIWLRNAGNIITGPLSSTIRSLALACAIKGGKEIAIIGHTDCAVSNLTAMQLIDRLHALGVERHRLPENLNEFFGTFASAQSNVIKAADFARRSPLIGPKVPVHGLMVEIQTCKLEWLVNGYDNLPTATSQWEELAKTASHPLDALKSIADFNLSDIKFPEAKIGETVTKAKDWLAQQTREIGDAPRPTPSEPKPDLPPKIPIPPPLRPRRVVRLWPKPK